MIKEYRSMDKDVLRKYLIENDFFDLATNTYYDCFLSFFCKKRHIDNEQLYHMATQILMHTERYADNFIESDNYLDYVAWIMGELNRRCTVIYSIQ